MAVRVQIQRVCDRCEKPYEQKQQGIADALPVFEKTILAGTMQAGSSEPVSLFRFEDLCGECDNVVGNLISRIRLDDKGEKQQERPRRTREPKDERRAETQTVKEADPVVKDAPEVSDSQVSGNSVAAAAAAALAAAKGNGISGPEVSSAQADESSEPY